MFEAGGVLGHLGDSGALIWPMGRNVCGRRGESRDQEGLEGLEGDMIESLILKIADVKKSKLLMSAGFLC